jgi:hypothetical protein
VKICRQVALPTFSEHFRFNSTGLFWNICVAENPNKTHRAITAPLFFRHKFHSAEHSEDNFHKRRHQKSAAAPTKFAALATEPNK